MAQLLESFVHTLPDTDGHDAGHTDFDSDDSGVRIISDRNVPKAEVVANKILCDSLVSTVSRYNCEICLLFA